MTIRIDRDIHKDPAQQAQVQDQLQRDYGVQATGNLVGQGYHDDYYGAPTLKWTDAKLKRITRLRLLSDPGLPFWDISYCHGVTVDGKPCKVELPMSQLARSRNGKRMWAELYAAGNRDNVHVNRLFAGADISTLC